MLREKSLVLLGDPGLGLFRVWGSAWHSELGCIGFQIWGFRVSDIVF